MALSNTLVRVKSIHAYAAVVALGIVFTTFGSIDYLQLAIVTLFFGFIALIDSFEDLSRSIDRVDSQLAEVNDQLDRVNTAEQGQTEDQERETND